MHVTRILAALIISCVSLGCSFHHPFARHSVEYGDAVAVAQNADLLKNILRAANREPRHYVAIGKVTGTIRGSVSLAAALPTGGNATNVFTFSPTLSLESGPTFDLIPLDSREFTAGIMTPVTPRLLKYYVDQGWPMDLLLYLLVREVELMPAGGGKPEVLTNEPGEDSFEDFQQFVEKVRGGLKVTLDPEAPVVAEIRAADLKGPEAEALLRARAEGLSVRLRDDGAVYEVRGPQAVRIRCERKACGGLVFDLLQEAPVARSLVPEALDSPSLANFSKSLLPDSADNGRYFKSVAFTLRSPEAVLYYLGELSRLLIFGADELAETRTVASAMPRIGSRDAPLFVLRRGWPGWDSPLRVRYRGAHYYVPPESGRTMHALTLLTQLIRLHRSAKDLPVTQTITTIPVE